MPGIKQVGEKQRAIRPQLPIIAYPFGPERFARDHFLRFESGIERFKNARERIFHRQIGRAPRHRDIQRHQHAIAHAQILRPTQFAIVLELRVMPRNRVTAILPWLLDQLWPRFGGHLGINFAAVFRQADRSRRALRLDRE